MSWSPSMVRQARELRSGDYRPMLMRRFPGVLMCSVLAVSCTSSGSGPALSEPSSDLDQQSRLDDQWARYLEHRGLFAPDHYPLATPPFECVDGGECVDSVNVGNALYEVYGPMTDSAPLGTTVATFDDGSEARSIDGVEPAIYLARVGSHGAELLVSRDAPTQTTSRERALEIRSDRCSIVGTLDVESFIDTAECDRQAVRWYVGTADTTWDLTDPFELSDPAVWRVEPIDAPAGSPSEFVLGPWGEQIGPYRDAAEAFDSVLATMCGALSDGECRAGYRTEPAERPDQVEALFVTQRSTPGSESRFETFYWRAQVEQLGDGGWWTTESGPGGVHQNGTGADGYADADQRFATCCTETTGKLTDP